MNPWERINRVVLKAIDSGDILKWDHPWIPNPIAQLKADGNPYQGLNQFCLGYLAKEEGFKSRHWPTYEMIRRLKGNVKGVKSITKVYWWNWRESEDPDTGKISKYPLLGSKAVWNADQVKWLDGILPEQYQEEAIEAPQIADGHEIRQRFWDWIDPFIKEKSNSLSIEWWGSKAFYEKLAHNVVLPPLKWFKTPEGSVSVAAHEIAHSTGHDSLLRRNLNNRKGDKNYAKEELIAEMTAMMVLNHLGIKCPEENKVSLAYCQSWGKRFSEDKQFFAYAYMAAQKTFNLMNWGEKKEESQRKHQAVNDQIARQEAKDYLCEQYLKEELS